VHSVTGYTRLFGWRSLLDDPATYGRALEAGRADAPALAAGGLAPGIAPGRLSTADGLAHTPVQTAELQPGETRALVLAAPGAEGYLVGTDESVDLAASPGPAQSDATATADAAPQLSVLGRKAALLAAAPGGRTVQVHNRGASPARVAWLGLLPPRLRSLTVMAQAEGGRVTLTPAGPAGFSAIALRAYGREGERTVETLAGGWAAAPAAAGHRLRGDLLYVQVTGTVGGVPVQSETTLLVPSGQSTD
jgi:hypothetical protein